jgi:hypothetical protein
MPNYLLLYTGGAQPKDEAEGRQVMADWMAWFTKLGDAANGGATVDGGNPTGQSKNIAPSGAVSDGSAGLDVTGYSVLKAADLAEATRLAKDCPHLKAHGHIIIFETVEAM